tara:strand:- start:3217 stop:5556 length:2340 start_codon:yes stop_codon:yes gene_type:complete
MDLENEDLEVIEEKYVREFTLTEYPDKDAIKTIFRHPDLHGPSVPLYRNYCETAQSMKGAIEIKYCMKDKYGRYYVEDTKMLSCSTMCKKVRSSLFGDTEYDVDIKSAHIQLLINEASEINLEHLDNYVNHRDEIFADMWINPIKIDKYNAEKEKKGHTETKKDLLKQLYTRILYGGLEDNWRKQFGLELEDVKLGSFHIKMISDLAMGSSYVVKGNKHKGHMKAIRKQIMDREEKEHNKKQEFLMSKDGRKKAVPFKQENIIISQGKMLSIYLQDRERLIIEKVFKYLKGESIQPTAYCYDGFQVLKKDIKDPDIFVNNINECVLDDKVEFIIKPFSDPFMDINKIEEPPDLWLEKEFDMLITQEQKTAYFDKYNIKILAMDGFCYLDNDGVVKKIKNMLFHYGWIYDKFVKDYIFTKHIPTYFNYGIYPNKKICPSTIYNLWTGFEMDKPQYDDIIPDGNIENILYHFKVVSNFNNDLTEYLLNYYAHIIQKPERKTDVCLLIQGQQGTGKTTLAEDLLKNIIGKKYVFDTCDVDKICGRFNGIVQGKLMGILNEATGRDTMGIIDKIKDSITRKDLLVEHKGIDPVLVKDYCNFIYTTNNVNPVKIDKDDRRFQVMECSSKYKGDTSYFNALYADIEDHKILKTFLKFLKERDISKFNCERDRVKTDAADDIHDMNKCPVEDFWDYIWSEDFNKYATDYKCIEMYNEFKLFQDMRGYKNVMNIKLFGKLIKRLCEPDKVEVVRRNYGMLFQFENAIHRSGETNLEWVKVPDPSDIE